MEDLAENMGCKTSTLPMKYLGLPLGASFKSRAVQDGLLGRMDNRLASWKKIYLLKGRRLTLIKSTLSSLPTYFMSLFPFLVANRMEKIQMYFLWGGLGVENKFHLVKWKSLSSC